MMRTATQSTAASLMLQSPIYVGTVALAYRDGGPLLGFLLARDIRPQNGCDPSWETHPPFPPPLPLVFPLSYAKLFFEGRLGRPRIERHSPNFGESSSRERSKEFLQ